MKSRLIALLREKEKLANQMPQSTTALVRLAEHLLANGVIVPPYKPLPLVDEGDRVLCPICETDLMGCYIGYDNKPTAVTCFECGAWIDSTKAVTREEAEKALAERKEV